MKFLKFFNESKEDYVSNPDVTKTLEEEGKSMSLTSQKYITKLINDRYPGAEPEVYGRRVVSDGMHIEVEYSSLVQISVGKLKYMYIYDFQRGIHISIYELKDEYFLVTVIKSEKLQFLYKCDQLDGVSELLKDNGII